MISFIHGSLCDIEENRVVVEAGGIGFSISVPSSVISGLPPEGSDIKLYTYYSVKEDSQSLYGFLYRQDLEMFKYLISVNGVGPKGALAILSVLNPDDLRLAIITGDSRAISKAQGIGVKTAERVILDLKDKVGDPGFADARAGALREGVKGVASRFAGPVAEAMEALCALGYSRSEAGRMLGPVTPDDSMSTQDIIKAALKRVKL